MKAKRKSAIICAALAVLSIGAARIGNDSGHLPAADYTKAVFSVTDYNSPSLISKEAENALVFAIDEREAAVYSKPYSDVLDPIIKPPSGLTEVNGGA